MEVRLLRERTVSMIYASRSITTLFNALRDFILSLIISISCLVLFLALVATAPIASTPKPSFFLHLSKLAAIPQLLARLSHVLEPLLNRLSFNLKSNNSGLQICLCKFAFEIFDVLLGPF